MSTVERAVAIAAQAHTGQTDKADQPYLLHPLRVLLEMETDEARMAAVLHDVVEDSDWTLEQLREEGFPEVVIAAVDSLTKRENENYDDFIDRAGRDPLGLHVKRADLRDNADLSRIPRPTEEDRERTAKYERALRRLAPRRTP